MQKRVGEANLGDPISLHMGRDFAQVGVDLTVQEALDSIRANPPASRVIYFYVADGEGRLCGVVPTRHLLLSPLDCRIGDIMISRVVAIPQHATVLDACEFFTLHRLLAFPVVDSERRVVGIVDVELYTDEISELEEAQRGDDLFQLIGVHLEESQQSSPWPSFRSRFPWLLCNIAGGLAAAWLSGFFQVELERQVALALFIPVVLALSESVAIQSVSLSLRLLHSRPPTVAALLAKLRSESLTGILLGTTCALLISTVAVAWLRDLRLGLCLLLGILSGVTVSAMVGVAIPNLLRLSRRDPQVASGPIALASADMLTLLLYFNLARALV
jgi:magnesium transporter